MPIGGNTLLTIRGDNELTTKEISRLIDWLIAHGLNYEDVESCIDYISGEKNTIATDNNK